MAAVEALDEPFNTSGQQEYCVDLANQVGRARSPWVAWGGGWSRRCDLAEKTLEKVSDTVRCIVLGENKPPHFRWGDYFSHQLGAPAVWRTDALFNLLKRYKPCAPSIRMVPYHLAIMADGDDPSALVTAPCRPQELSPSGFIAAGAELRLLVPILASQAVNGPVPENVGTSATPAVSIVICAFNEAPRIGWAILSVLAQTRRDWELIVVDDGSIDGTAPVVGEFKDPRIVLEVFPHNQGKAFALNRALELARSPFLLELDADDWLAPQALDLLCTATGQLPPHVGLVTAHYHLWRQHNRHHLSYRGVKNHLPVSITASHARVPIPRCYRVALLRKVGGWTIDDPSHGRLFEDVAMTLKIIKEASIASIPEPVYHRLVRRHSVSQQVNCQYSKWKEGLLPLAQSFVHENRSGDAGVE